MKKKAHKNSRKKDSPNNRKNSRKSSKPKKRGRKPGGQPFTKAQRVEMYVNYLADPDRSGGKTKEEFARDVLLFKGNDVDRQLYDYQHEKGFWDAVWERFTDHYLQGQLPEINRELVKKAKAGSQWAIELVLKLAKRLEDRIGEGPKMVLPDNLIVTIRKNEPRSASTKDPGD